MKPKNKTRKQKKNKKRLTGGWSDKNNAFVKHEALIKNLHNFEENMTALLIEYLLQIDPSKVPKKLFIQNDIYPKQQFVWAFNWRKWALNLNLINPSIMIDNDDYSSIKISVIPVGTVFRRRHKESIFQPNTTTGQQKSVFKTNNAIWLDYTSRLEPDQPQTRQSFLLDPRSYKVKIQENSRNKEFIQNSLTNRKYVKGAIHEFGPYLIEFRTTKPLVIMHFPTRYEDPSDPNNYWAYDEYYLRYIFDHSHLFSYIDGYTLDFLYYNPNDIYKNLPPLPHYRELYLENGEGLEVISQVKLP